MNSFAVLPCRFIALLLIIWPISAVKADNATSERIEVLVEDAYPMQYMERGNYLGPIAERVIKLLAKADIEEYQFTLIPWPRAVVMAKNKPNTLIVGLARTLPREQDYLWIAPVITLDYQFYSTATILQEVAIDDSTVKSLRVGTVINSMLDQHLRSQGFTSVEAVPYAEQNFDKLSNHRVDVIPASSSDFMASCRIVRHDCHRFVPVLPIDLPTKTLWLAASKTTEKHLIERLNLAAKSIEP